MPNVHELTRDQASLSIEYTHQLYMNRYVPTLQGALEACDTGCASGLVVRCARRQDATRPRARAARDGQRVAEPDGECVPGQR